MKKFGLLFVLTAVLLALLLAGCSDVLQEPGGGGDKAGEEELGPAPTGKVWVKIPVPDESARTLTAADNPIFINYYEVYFHERTNDYLWTGTAKKGEQLIVSVIPDVTYDVLLLAGDRATRTLLASAYATAPIASNTINQVNLTLKYILSDPNTAASSDFKFTYTDNTGPTYDGVSAAGTYYEVSAVSLVNQGTGYSNGELISISSAAGELATILKVTDESGGVIQSDGLSIVSGGRYISAPSGTVSTVTLAGSGGSNATVAVTTRSGSDVPATIPWLSYVSGNRSNPLGFEITTRNLGSLISAGGSGGAGSSYFKLAKAELWLEPLNSSTYNFPLFTPVGDNNSHSAPFTPSINTDDITIQYVLPAVDINLIPADTYGMVYYILDYYAFGDRGSKWTIRNGIDINEADKGEKTRGAGLLVKIGNPGKFGTRVDVTVGL